VSLRKEKPLTKNHGIYILEGGYSLSFSRDFGKEPRVSYFVERKEAPQPRGFYPSSGEELKRLLEEDLRLPEYNVGSLCRLGAFSGSLKGEKGIKKKQSIRNKSFPGRGKKMNSFFPLVRQDDQLCQEWGGTNDGAETLGKGVIWGLIAWGE